MSPIEQQNVEIKACIPGGEADMEQRIEIARKLTKQIDGVILNQRDVFFNAPLSGGRLKLRYFNKPARAELIYYERPDKPGPKLSKYNKMEIDEAAMLEKILTQSNGVLGEVTKQRILFTYDNKRIHFDKVKDLGCFIELEICLSPEHSIDEANEQALKFLQKFGVEQDDLRYGSYLDELNKNVTHL